MDLQLAGDVVVVTGGARGIGLAIARAFAAEGARVALVDRDAAVAAAAESLAAFEEGSLGIEADIADFDAMTHAAGVIRERLGRVEHVAHAAAIGSRKFGFPFWNLDPGDWPKVLEVNVVGAVNVAHAFAPMMVEARRGTLVFLASVAGQIGSQTDPPYSASKAALINFAQCAAKDLAPYDVRVNTICPGMVKTELNHSVWRAWQATQPEGERASFETWAEEKIRRGTPLGRWQEADDIAAMAVFLASNAARNITGQTINVDGGQVMHW